MELIAPYIPFFLTMIVAGLFAGFVAGMFGIGGGFVVVPTLVGVLSILASGDSAISDDKIMHVAIGTSLATIVVTSLRSVSAHAKRGAVDFTILRTWAPFVVAGVIIGMMFAKFLDAKALKLLFGAGVFLMAWHFLFPFLSKRAPLSQEMPEGLTRAGLGGVLGAFCALLGIGGGTPAILIMTLNGVTMHRAVATAAGFGTMIAVPGALVSIMIGLGETGLPVGSVGYVNLIALVGITTMSVLTAPLGVAAAHSFDPVKLRRVFGIYLLATSSFMLYNGLMPKHPADDPSTTHQITQIQSGENHGL